MSAVCVNRIALSRRKWHTLRSVLKGEGDHISEAVKCHLSTAHMRIWGLSENSFCDNDLYPTELLTGIPAWLLEDLWVKRREVELRI
jgi:hypothetical protein